MGKIERLRKNRRASPFQRETQKIIGFARALQGFIRRRNIDELIFPRKEVNAYWKYGHHFIFKNFLVVGKKKFGKNRKRSDAGRESYIGIT